VRVLQLAWLGIPVEDYAAMVSLFANVLELRTEFEEPATIELLSLPNDDKVQLFGHGVPGRLQDGNLYAFASRRRP
jgi:hypothetical protein